MSIHTDIADLESILTNSGIPEYSPEELASMEELLSKYRRIEALWEEFGDVPMNPCLETIEQPWHRFPAGTHREAIWHWFEEEFHISVAKDLMYDETPDNFEKYLSAYIHEELIKAGYKGTKSEIGATLLRVTSNDAVMGALYAAVDEAMSQLKNDVVRYTVETFNKKTGNSIRTIEAFDEYENAALYEARYKDIFRLNENEGTRISKVRYNSDDEEIHTEIISV